MKEEKKTKFQTLTGNVYFRLGLTVFILYLLTYYWSRMEKVLVMFGNAMVPLIVGGIIAYAVNILMGFFEKNYDRVLRGRRAQRAKRTVCILCAYLLLVLIIAGIIGILVPQLSTCVSLLIARSGAAIDQVVHLLKSVPALAKYGAMLEQSVSGMQLNGELVQKAIHILQSGNIGWLDNVTGVLQKVTGVAATLFIGLFFSFYLLSGKEKYGSQFRRVVHTYCPAAESKLFEVLDVLNNSFRQLYRGTGEGCLRAGHYAGHRHDDFPDAVCGNDCRYRYGSGAGADCGRADRCGSGVCPDSFRVCHQGDCFPDSVPGSAAD
mgnify:CR=1 FL=1